MISISRIDASYDCTTITIPNPNSYDCIGLFYTSICIRSETDSWNHKLFVFDESSLNPWQILLGLT